MRRRRPRRLPRKVCATCGRPFAWRRRWAGCWDEVRHCSERCRRTRPRGLERAIERATLELLARRRPEASVCPGEVARALAPEEWRPLMPAVRRVAARLAEAGRVRVTQGAKTVEPRTARGPIRLRRGEAFEELA